MNGKLPVARCFFWGESRGARLPVTGHTNLTLFLTLLTDELVNDNYHDDDVRGREQTMMRGEEAKQPERRLGWHGFVHSAASLVQLSSMVDGDSAWSLKQISVSEGPSGECMQGERERGLTAVALGVSVTGGSISSTAQNRFLAGSRF